MGLKRPTVVMNEEEKEHTAYHEGGHAVAAYVLEHADPVHKVTILPTGMALGMTQQLPEEEKYSHDKEFLDDMLSVLLGGRVAEQLIFGSQSTGAQNDLVRGTEIARRMVREWGMSDRIGPMAWGSQGAVFLGEDLVHTRDYSDETARVIDEEVERILRSQEDRTLEHAHAVPARARGGRHRRCSSTRRWTGSRWSAWSTTPWATAPAVPARWCSPTARSRRSTTRASAIDEDGRPVPIQPIEATRAVRPWGARCGSRRRAAQRSVALTDPTNDRRTTPSASAISTIGTPEIS